MARLPGWPTAAGTWSVRSYGIRVLKTLCRISLEPDSCVSQTQTRFERWGINSLVIAKFVPGLAIIAPPMAGALRIGWLRFIVLSTCGAVLWVGGGLAAGMLFKSQIDRVAGAFGRIGSIAGAGRRGLAGRLHRIQVVGAQALLQDAAHGADQRRRSVRAHASRRRAHHHRCALSHGARRSSRAGYPARCTFPCRKWRRHLKDLPRDRDIILYCTCPSEASAARVAKMLMNHGFKRVRPLYGGLDAWVAAGYAVVARREPP